MVDKIFYAKTASRMLHLLTATFLIGQAFNLFAVMSGCVNAKGTGSLFTWMWALSMISGFSNMIIIMSIRKPHKEAHKAWKYALYAKFALMFFILPTHLRWISGWFSTEVSESSVVGLQFFFAILILVVSVLTRFYREDVTKAFTVINGSNEEFRKFSNETSVNGGSGGGIQMQRLD